jgi:hypothetical protein
MRIASNVARYILGILFTVFGLNGFLQFIPAVPMPGLAGQFVTVLIASHYMIFVFVVQLICGLLLLADQYVPLALALIGPVIVNILLFHVSMNLSGIVPGALATVCWIVMFHRFRANFAGIFERR